MRKPPPLSVALLLLSLSACSPSIYRADIGAAFVQARGEVALQNSGGSLTLHNEQNRMDEDLGVGDLEASPYLRLEWQHGDHRVRAHGFGFDSDGSGRLMGDFGDIVAGALVNTEADFFSASAAYSYGIFDNKNFRIGVGGQLGYSLLDIEVRSATLMERVQTDVLVPMPFLEGEIYLGPFTFAANGSIMTADLGDGDGRYVDAEALARWQASDDLQFLAGYRLLIMDSYGTATGRDFDADVQFDGWFIGGGVRF